MAVAPAYADLGKNAKKILTEGYNGKLAKLNVNHGLPGGCIITTATSLDTQTASTDLALDLTTKMTSPDKGVTVTDKRGINKPPPPPPAAGAAAKPAAPAHLLTAAVANFADVRNLVLTADSTGKLNLTYKNHFVNESIDFLQDSQTVKPTVCLSKNQFSAGLTTSMSFETGNGPEKTCIAAGYMGKSIQAHAHADADFTKVGATLWGTHGKIEGAALAATVLATGAVTAEVGARYTIDKGLFVGAKVDTNLNVGLSAKKAFPNNLALSTSVVAPVSDPSALQLGAGLDFSHNFEVMDKLKQSMAPKKPPPAKGEGENDSKNNSTSSKRMTLIAPTKPRKQRVGATSKELGENCADAKCKPVKKPWQ